MTGNDQHVYEVRPRKGNRGVDLISDALHSVACGMMGRTQSVKGRISHRTHGEAQIKNSFSHSAIHFTSQSVASAHLRRGPHGDASTARRKSTRRPAISVAP